MQAAVYAAACITAPALFAPAAMAQVAAPVPVADAAYAALSARLFPLFTALGQDSGALAALQGDARLREVAAARAGRLALCDKEPGCVAQALVWTDGEIAAVAAAIPAHMPHFDDGVAAQAARELQGINAILGTYGLGHVPPYPKIDGSGALDASERQAWLLAAYGIAHLPRAGSIQPFDRSMDFALALLDGSNRTDAVGFLPLDGGLNEAPFALARQVDWSTYRYSALIVTGIGPEIDGMPLSPGGKYHLRLAAEQFARGEAAFIIVSGGRAHPFNTPFAEAVEMRTALIERYGIPADRIVIDPHARHTTTNMRNAARLLMEMGAPAGMATLVVCNPMQSAAIESDAFVQRNMRELGYAPGTAGVRISPTALEWRIAPASARIDPRDPLDP